MSSLFQKRCGNWLQVWKQVISRSSVLQNTFRGSVCIYFYRKSFLFWFWYTISHKKIEKSDYVWLKVTMSAYEPKYGWQKGNSGDCDLRLVTTGQYTRDYRWLRAAVTFGFRTCDHTGQANLIIKIVILHYASITEEVCLKIFRKVAEIRC